ncbi:MAG: hypothetical protein V1720_18675 [bacterium]
MDINEKEDILPVLIEKLSNDFSFEKKNLPAQSDLSLIREHLKGKVAVMLEKNYERLLNNLYRIDVDEEKLNTALKATDPAELPSVIADMIIERQMQRIRTQILYKQGKL